MNANEKMTAQLAAKLDKRAAELLKDGARLNAINKPGSAATLWKAAEMLKLVIGDLK